MSMRFTSPIGFYKTGIRLFVFVQLQFITASLVAMNLSVCANCSVRTIEEAVSMADRFDTIQVKSGTYICANVEINKPLTLIGEKEAVLDGNQEGYVLKILADSVTVSGFKIINTGRSYTKDLAAIYASRVKYLQVTNNKIENALFGLLIEKSKYGHINGNTISGQAQREDDSGNGIHLWHCSGFRIADNVVSGLRDGIYLEFVDSTLVQSNHAYKNIRYGLHFMFSNHDQYIGNTFENNGAGVAVMFSKFIRMEENRFINNWGTASYGLLLKEIYDAEVLDNEFSENTIGVFTEGSTRINYLKNRFVSNGWALKIAGACYKNTFSHNAFVSNSFDLSYSGKLNDNVFKENYWSEYTGYDLDRDGYGDIPYRPVKLFSYIVNQTPETIVLLRSLFIDMINFSERVSPIFTPESLLDERPLMSALP